ncbi:hypothetical protein F4805DRAFT_475801 [Annulohypoxylon moriforme]|nr:hypothetical protein F4805DRAFT_475801 [Annulohypoxylon moriforme]
MVPHYQVLNIDFDNRFIDNASRNASTLKETSDSQRAALQPVIRSSLSPLGGKGLPGIHVKDTSYQSLKCTCGIEFSRSDALNRHIKSKSNDVPKHPCKNCNRRQGMNGFRRRDHLAQHMKSCRGRNVGNNPHNHEAEPFPAAAMSGPLTRTREDSLSQVQNPEMAPFPCLSLGCDRVGPNGYLRSQDLIEHWGWAHPGMIESFLADLRSSGIMYPSQMINYIQISQLYEAMLDGTLQPDIAFQDLQPEITAQTLGENDVLQFDVQDGTSQFQPQL